MLFVLLLIGSEARAQFEQPVLSARGTAMGACVSGIDDFWSGMQNLTASELLRKPTVGVAYRQSFLASGMGYKAVAASLPVAQQGAWMLWYGHLGNVKYNEQTLSTGYTTRLGKRLSMGAMLHYLHSSTSHSHYDPLNRLTFSLGLRYRYSSSFSLAFNTFNPAMVATKRGSDLLLPTTFNVGVAYYPMPLLLTTVEAYKRLGYNLSLRWGLEYKLHKTFALRAGINSEPVCYSLGAAYLHSHGSVDFAIQMHNLLGLTPHLSLTYGL